MTIRNCYAIYLTGSDDPDCSLACHNDSYCATTGIAADDACICQDGFLSTDNGCEGQSRVTLNNHAARVKFPFNIVALVNIAHTKHTH